MNWSKRLPARKNRGIELSVDESGIRLMLDDSGVGLTKNQAGDLAHALLEAVRVQENTE